MTWAPCFDASWAACSCFWIIDSLSPVQVACRSAPRTVRGIGRSPSTSVFDASAVREARVHRPGIERPGCWGTPGSSWRGRKRALAIHPGVEERGERRCEGVQAVDPHATGERADRVAVAEVDPDVGAAAPDHDVAGLTAGSAGATPGPARVTERPRRAR